MQRLAGMVLTVAMVCLPCLAGAMSQEAFDRKAIPMLSKPAQASKLLALCEEALKGASDKDFEIYVRVVKSHAHLLKKEYDKAEAEAQRAIDSGRQPDLAYTAMMEVLFTRGKYDEGGNVCLERARKIDNAQRRAVAERECEAIAAQQKSAKPAPEADPKSAPQPALQPALQKDESKARNDQPAPPKGDDDMSYSLSGSDASPNPDAPRGNANTAGQQDDSKNDPS